MMHVSLVMLRRKRPLIMLNCGWFCAFLPTETASLSNRVAHQCMSVAQCGCNCADINCLGGVEPNGPNMAALFHVRKSLFKNMGQLRGDLLCLHSTMAILCTNELFLLILKAREWAACVQW
jgi:hypothetical protein